MYTSIYAGAYPEGGGCPYQFGKILQFARVFERKIPKTRPIINFDPPSKNPFWIRPCILTSIPVWKKKRIVKKEQQKSKSVKKFMISINSWKASRGKNKESHWRKIINACVCTNVSKNQYENFWKKAHKATSFFQFLLFTFIMFFFLHWIFYTLHICLFLDVVGSSWNYIQQDRSSLLISTH